MHATFRYCRPFLFLMLMLSRGGLGQERRLDFWELDSVMFYMQASIPMVQEMLDTGDYGTADAYLLQSARTYEEPDSSKYYAGKAKDAYREQGDGHGLHMARAFEAKAFWYQSKYDEAVKLLEEELEYAIRNEDRFLQFYSLFNLFKTHYQLYNFSKAYQYLNEAELVVASKGRFRRGQMEYFRLILYQSMTSFPSGVAEKIDHRKCVELAKGVIPILEEMQNHCLRAKAEVLLAHSLSMGGLASKDSCLKVYDRAVNLALIDDCPEPFEFALANKFRFMAASGMEVSDVDSLLGMLSSQPQSLTHMSWAYAVISGVYAGIGDYESAFRASEESRKFLLEVYNRSHTDALAEQAMKFETFKKDMENERLAAQIAFEKAEKDKLWLYFSLIMIFLMGAAATYWINFRNKARQREQQIITRNILEGEQKERIRLARDLHDSVGQLLSALKLQFSTLKLDKPKQLHTEKLLNKTIEEVRSISHNLIPKALDYFGLIRAIEDMAEQYNTIGKVHIQVNSIGGKKPLSISKQQQLMLFRIVQENIQNIVKHSQSADIGINIFNLGVELKIDITYQGPGITMDKVTASKGIGWKNILARIKLLNGEISFGREGGESVIRMRVKMAA